VTIILTYVTFLFILNWFSFFNLLVFKVKFQAYLKLSFDYLLFIGGRRFFPRTNFFVGKAM